MKLWAIKTIVTVKCNDVHDAQNRVLDALDNCTDGYNPKILDVDLIDEESDVLADR